MIGLKVSEEKESLIFPRKEIKVMISAEVTPSYSVVKSDLAKKFSVPEENIRIKKVEGRFGAREFNVTAFIYKTKSDLDKIEVKTKQEKEAEKKATEEMKANESKSEGSE
ncbi:MAG: hypothetical protein Q7S56_01420 [Nanoarchaeota archaeon]|nr:hypothetical protein [Nanoarchaeota archaeon]